MNTKKEINVGFNLRNILSGFLLALFLLPAIALANSEFKGKETVNINKASVETLAAYLRGVGASKAQAIVDFRKENGKFKKITDLNNVPGIGEETYKDIKKNVSTSRGKSVAPEGYTMPTSTGSSKPKRKSTKKKKSTSSSSSRSSDSTSSSSSSRKSTKKSDSNSSTSSRKSSKSSGSDSNSSGSKRSSSSSSSSSKSKKPKKPKKAKKSKKKPKKKDKKKKKKSS